MLSSERHKSLPEALDHRIAELAERQYGVFTRAQARALGAGNAAVRYRVDRGRWNRVSSGVYRLAGTGHSWLQSLMAACLAWGPGSVISHLAAAALWKLPGFERRVVELTVPRGRRRQALGARIHRPVSLDGADVTMLYGIPVTSAARTLMDVAAISPRDAVEEALDDALRRRLVSLPQLRWRLRETGGSGRPGIEMIRELVEARTNMSVPKSVFETRLLRELKAADLPAPDLQHEIRDGGRLVARVDFAFPDLKLAIEADGYRWHSSRIRWQKDLTRRNALTALGWRVIHVTWEDMTERPDETVRAIILVLQR